MKRAGIALMAVALLCAVGVVAHAETTGADASGPSAGAVVQPDDQGEPRANAGTGDANPGAPVADQAVPSVPQAATGQSRTRQKMKLQVAVQYSPFFPSDHDTRDNFGSRWDGFGLALFRPECSMKWVFDWSASVLTKNGRSDALLIPATVGVKRALRCSNPELRPYVALRAGPYYGKVDDNLMGSDDTTIGANANVSVGVYIQQRYIVEARYDWFTRLAGNNFNGFTVTVGARVFGFSL